MDQSNFKKPGAHGLWPRAPGLKLLLASKIIIMVYDHHNYYTVSIVYDYRPLEAFQKLK